MARTLYIASTNPGKLRDFALAAARHNILILPLPGLATIEPPEEDAPTFAGNARKKATYYSRFLPGEMVLADDSGLEVDYLDGAPGVPDRRSAHLVGLSPFVIAKLTKLIYCLLTLCTMSEINI